MARPIRAPRTAPKGRPGHGFYPDEFTPYPDSDGRADPKTCHHDVFLDHSFPWTHICLDCGAEFTVQEGLIPQTLLAGDTVLINSTLRPDTLAVEGILLTDDELGVQRHRWHAIWGMDGWTSTGPEHEDLVPPARLKAQMTGIPPERSNKSVIHPHTPKQ